MLKFYILLLLASTSLECFNFKQLNPFAAETLQETVSFEYPCEQDSTICIESPGTLQVKTWKNPQLLVQVTKRGSSVALKSAHINVKHEGKKISIIPSFSTDEHPELEYSLMIPEKSVLKANIEGNISIINSAAPVFLTSLKGNIKVLHAQSTVHAHAPHGKVKLKQRSLPSDASIFVDSYYSSKIYLSRNHHASIHAKSLTYPVSINLFVTIDPITTQLTKDDWNRLMKNVHVTLGNGTASVTVESTKGYVEINEL